MGDIEVVMHCGPAVTLTMPGAVPRRHLVLSLTEFDKIYPNHPNRDVYEGHFMRTKDAIVAYSPDEYQRIFGMAKDVYNAKRVNAMPWNLPAMDSVVANAAKDAMVKRMGDSLRLPNVHELRCDPAYWAVTLPPPADSATLGGKIVSVNEDGIVFVNGRKFVDVTLRDSCVADAIAKRDAIIAEMTATISALRAASATPEPEPEPSGLLTESVTMLARWGR